MTSKLIAGGAFFVAVAITPALVGAHAGHKHSCDAHHKGHHKGEPCDHGAKGKKPAKHQATKGKKRSSWDVVQKDPCLAKKYKRFAAKNKSEKARRKYVDQLAHDGCPKRDHHVVRHDGHGEASHAERTRHYDGDREPSHAERSRHYDGDREPSHTERTRQYDDDGGRHTDRARHYDDDRPARTDRAHDDRGRYSARHWNTYDEDAQPAARRSDTYDEDNEPEVRSPLLDLFR